MGKSFPVLKCFATSSGQVKAWCPFCKKWHTHGFPDKITKAGKIGHWAAHCHDKSSPFHKTGGYELTLMSKKEIIDITKSLDRYKG
ncbi:hypothetical protein LCGC14_2107920 [marine sediment metagenome]|uniref:Uncharacterized protein n=1 Tax=marine sediment metagenome TaxID=412755 RepID=A0A0F9E849_9ZZZZ